jgi:CRISPR/Cas system-associated exonuclease Cas4 (RecB family)
VRVHVLADYWYCAAKIINRKIQGDLKTPLLVEGSRIHEEEAKKVLAELGPTRRVHVESVMDSMLLSWRNIKRALVEKKRLANSKEHVLFMTILPELGIIGVPDGLDCADGALPIIVEEKTTDRLPGRPWPDHELQVAVYMMGLERLEFRPPFGILEYVKRADLGQRKRYKITLDGYLRNKAQLTAQIVFNLLSGKEEPKPTKYPRKCVPCRFNSSCQWRLRPP